MRLKKAGTMARQWTVEQKKEAAERMRAIQLKRWANKKGDSLTNVETPDINPVVAEVERAPEVQAVIDSMDPQRKAKMMMAQGRVWQDNGRADGKAAREALERFEADKQGIPSYVPEVTRTVASNAVMPDAFHAMAAQVAPQRDLGRVGSREVNLIVRTDGTMVSQHGPCVCGRAKREWHGICLKQ